MTNPKAGQDVAAPRPVVLVTGAAGRIGRAAVRTLAGDYQVIACDVAPQRNDPPSIECIHLDLTSDDSVAACLRRVRTAHGPRIASVLHLAAYYDFKGDPSPMYDELTVRGTGRLVRGLRDFDVEQFVFASTMVVHAPTVPGQPLNEEAPLAGTWPYPQSKIATETLLRETRGKMPVVALRIAGVYTDHCDSIPLAGQIERILDKPIEGRVFPGDASHGQAFVHMDDLADAIRRTIDRRSRLPDQVLPILIGEPVTYGYATLQSDLARLLLGEPDRTTHEVPPALVKAVTWLQDRLPGTEPLVRPWMIDRAADHYELDISRARALLGWSPRHDLRRTLPRIAEHLAVDPAGWARRNGIELRERTVEKLHRDVPSGTRR